MAESIPVSEVTFDEVKWNEKRRRENSINRGREYYGRLVRDIYKKYGFEGTQCNNEQMMEMGKRYVARAIKNFRIVGNDARTMAAYIKIVDKLIFDADFEIMEDTPRRVRMRGGSGCPLSRNPQEELCYEICRGAPGHEVVAAEIINPAYKFGTPSPDTSSHKMMSNGDPYCELTFEFPEDVPISNITVPVSLYKIDWDEWPESRVLKSRQRRAWEDYGSLVRALYAKYGKESMELVYKLTSDSADNYVFWALKNHGLIGNDARTAGGYYKLFHKLIWTNDLEIVEDTPNRVVLRNSGYCPFSLSKAPAEQEGLAPELCLGSMGHEYKACEIVNPKIKFSVPSLRSAGAPYCEYVFQLED